LEGLLQPEGEGKMKLFLIGLLVGASAFAAQCGECAGRDLQIGVDRAAIMLVGFGGGRAGGFSSGGRSFSSGSSFGGSRSFSSGSSFGGSRSSGTSSFSRSSGSSSFGGNRSAASSGGKVTITRPAPRVAPPSPGVSGGGYYHAPQTVVHHYDHQPSFWSHFWFWQAMSNQNRPIVVANGGQPVVGGAYQGEIGTTVVVQQHGFFYYAFWSFFWCGIVSLVGYCIYRFFKDVLEEM
jgi:hypothetical protein